MIHKRPKTNLIGACHLNHLVSSDELASLPLCVFIAVYEPIMEIAPTIIKNAYKT